MKLRKWIEANPEASMYKAAQALGFSEASVRRLLGAEDFAKHSQAAQAAREAAKRGEPALAVLSMIEMRGL